MSTNNGNVLDFGAGKTEALENVYFYGSTDPSDSGATFNPDVPMDASKLYIGSDGSTWVWNGTAYISKDIPLDISRVGDCARIYQSVPGTATIASTVTDFVRLDSSSYQYGSTVIPLVSMIKLLAGYRYRIEASVSGAGNAVNSVPRIGFYTSASSAGPFTLFVRSPRVYVIPSSFTQNNASQAYAIQTEIECSTDTFLRLYTTGEGVGTYVQTSDGSTYMTALNIGVI